MRRFTDFGFAYICRWIQFWPASIRAPASVNLSNTASSKWAFVSFKWISPPVAVQATKKVPVSIRSGITLNSAPCNDCTPSIVMTSVPAPYIFAPMAIKQWARSTISGSRAAFSRMVVPAAKVAAIIRFSVPVTVTISNTMRAPCNVLATAWI